MITTATNSFGMAFAVGETAHAIDYREVRIAVRKPGYVRCHNARVKRRVTRCDSCGCGIRPGQLYGTRHRRYRYCLECLEPGCCETPKKLDVVGEYLESLGVGA